MSNQGDLATILAKMESIESGTKFDPSSVQSSNSQILDCNGRPVVTPVTESFAPNSSDDLDKVANQMGNILGAMGDIFGNAPLTPTAEYVPQQNTSSGDVDYTAMYDTLDGEGDYDEQYSETGEYIPPVQAATITPEYHYNEPQITVQAAINKEPELKPGLSVCAHVKGSSWRLLEEDAFGYKSAKIYQIQNIHDGSIILDNIMMYESAVALLRLLHEGRSLSSPKVLGIISSGLQYSVVLEGAIKKMKERKVVLNNKEYGRAQELDVEIEEYQTKAETLKTSVIQFLKNEGFM